MGEVVVTLVSILAASSLFLGAYQWWNMPVWFLCHVVGMILAWALMVVGSAVYKGAKTRPQVRILHGIIQTLAFLAACIGYYGIYKQHELGGKRQFHIWPLNNAKTIHVLIGYVVLAGMIMQVCQGWARKLKMDAGVFTKYLTHPYQGQAVFVFAGGNILLAAYFMGLSTATIVMSNMIVIATLGTMLPIKAKTTVTDLKQKLLGVEPSDLQDTVIGA